MVGLLSLTVNTKLVGLATFETVSQSAGTVRFPANTEDNFGKYLVFPVAVGDKDLNNAPVGLFPVTLVTALPTAR